MGLFSRRVKDDSPPALLASAATAEVMPSPLRRIEGFTAAAQVIDLVDPRASEKAQNAHRKRPLQWQRDGWRYHDDLSEVRTYGRFMGDTQSRVRLYPAILADDPQQAPVAAHEAEGVNPADIELANMALAALSSEEGDRQEIQRIFGLNLGIAGEVWLVGTEQEEYATAENPTGESWRACSVEEISATTDGRWAIKPWENAKYSDLEYLDPENSTLIRIYRRHGRWRLWPDSPMRSANLICEELLLSTQHIMGVLRSRIPMGILPIPDDIEEEADEDEDADQEANSGDITLNKLMKHLTTPLSDPRSAATLAPFLMKVPSAALDKIKLIDLYKAIDPEEGARIEQLIRRLAIAVDMPPESLTGTAGLNHWSAWLVGEDAVRNHVEPYTQLYADPLTLHYFQPRLEAAGVPNARRWVIAWDARECIAHPDAKQNAQDGWDRLVISDHTYVTSLGFSEDDMPDEEEIARREEQAAKMSQGPVDSGSVKQAPPDAQQIASASVRPGSVLRRVLDRQQGRALAAGMAEGINGFRPDVLESAEYALLAAASGPSIGQRWARIESQLQRDLVVASDAALRRVMERAQARIRSAAQKDASARAAVAGLELEQLAAALGPDEVRRLGLSEQDLVAGGFGALAGLFVSLVSKARAQALDALKRLGVDLEGQPLDDYEARAQANASEGWDKLESTLMGAAIGLLFSGSSTPAMPAAGEFDAALSSTPGDIREALGVAGGGAPPDAGDHLIGLLGGADFTSFLDDLQGFDRAGWVWEVGAPQMPFEPHQELAGVEFASWFDDALAADPGEFPFVTYYSPDDHDGCQCSATPTGEATVSGEEPPED